jgi:hypothetical protein
MILANKMKKYFGKETGTWWCKLGECLYIFSTKEIKEMDERGEISWARPNKNQRTILPICPQHGTLLSHAEEGNIDITDNISILM